MIDAGAVLKDPIKFDRADKPIASTDGNSKTTTYGYDSVHQLTGVTDADANWTASAFDQDGRITWISSPNGYTTQQCFDGAGRLTQITTPDGGVVNFTYDGANRRLSDGNGTFTLDGEGRTLTAFNNAGTYTFNYDASGRLTQVVEPFSLTLNYAYDAAGNQTQVIDSLVGLVERQLGQNPLAGGPFVFHSGWVVLEQPAEPFGANFQIPIALSSRLVSKTLR